MSAAMIGIGLLGVTHPHASGRVRYLQSRDDVALVGAADDDPVIVPFTRDLHLARRTEQEILDDPAVDAVIIHAKSSRMVPLSIQAIKAGKAVLVEKPGGTSPADLAELVAAVDANHAVCQVGYNFRFASSIALVAKVLADDALGDVMQVRVHGACSLGEASTSHLNQPDDMGGALWVIGCHVLDLALSLFGMPESINARVPKFTPRPGVVSGEDAAAIVMSYPELLITMDFFSWDALPWLESWSLEVHGTNGSLRASALPSRLEVFLAKPSGSYAAGWTRWEETSFPTPWAAGPTEYSPELSEIANRDFFAREGEAFIDAIRRTAPVAVTAQDAFNVATVIAAAYESDRAAGASVPMRST